MEQTAANYDFAKFEQSTTPHARRLRPKNKKQYGRKSRSSGRVPGLVICSIILVFLICGLLYSNAQLTRITKQIQDTQNSLTAAKSENDYLQSKLESVTGMRNVEEMAAGDLGLMKLDQSQITYLSLENESVIVCTESGFQQFFSGIQAGLLSVWGRLG